MTSPVSSSPKPFRRWKLLILLVLLTFSPALLVFGYYGFVDWEGAYVLAATKAKWVAKGESFDPSSFIPSPIPDDQNLAAIPLFKLSIDPKTGKLVPLALQAALNGTDIQVYSIHLKAIKPASYDLICKAIAKRYAMNFPSGKEKDPITQFNLIFQFGNNSSLNRRFALSANFPLIIIIIQFWIDLISLHLTK